MSDLDTVLTVLSELIDKAHLVLPAGSVAQVHLASAGVACKTAQRKARDMSQDLADRDCEKCEVRMHGMSAMLSK